MFAAHFLAAAAAVLLLAAVERVRCAAEDEGSPMGRATLRVERALSLPRGALLNTATGMLVLASVAAPAACEGQWAALAPLSVWAYLLTLSRERAPLLHPTLRRGGSTWGRLAALAAALAALSGYGATHLQWPLLHAMLAPAAAAAVAGMALVRRRSGGDDDDKR